MNVPLRAATMTNVLHGNFDVMWDVSTATIYDWGWKKMARRHGARIIKVTSGTVRI
jgi:hypothetical protein